MSKKLYVISGPSGIGISDILAKVFAGRDDVCAVTPERSTESDSFSMTSRVGMRSKSREIFWSRQNLPAMIMGLPVAW